MNEYMMIGEVLRPQGVKGEAKVRPHTANPDAFKKWTTLYLQDGTMYTPISVKCSRVHDGFAYLTLGECSTPEEVDKLRGRQLFIDRAHANRLGKNEVYIVDLIGCEAVNETGEVVGTLKDVLQNGPVDVYVFQTKRGTMMAPAILAAFPQVDAENKKMTVCQARLDEVAVFEN